MVSLAADTPVGGRIRRRLSVQGVVVGLLAVGVATGVAFALDPLVPALSLGALYSLAMLPVAVAYGRPYAVAVAVVSMVVFNFLFLPPTLTLTLHGGENWLVFGIYTITGLLVSDLATRARRRALEAEQREREAAFLAELASVLLSGAGVADELPRIADGAARVLGVPWAQIDLDSTVLDVPEGGEALALRVGNGSVFTLTVPQAPRDTLGRHARFVKALASVLGIALDRERLAHEALETEALRRSDVLKTALLRTVSHNLRSPLTAIRASLEALVSAELVLDEVPRDALLRSALTEARRLDRTVANLLDLSRLQAGAARPAPRPRAIDGLLNQALSHFTAERSRVRRIVGGELAIVEVDPDQLEQAFVNVLDNAFKFSPPDSVVIVSAVRVGGEVHVRIEDAGPGVRPAELEHVFGPFEQGSASGMVRGTGLGLAIARGFVEGNGGRVWAEHAETGGRFVISLPRIDPTVKTAE